ncbi:MAG: ABC transporter ATP-binding protein [Lachnospiraceae bacterium]|nr:ABC transporter ATP-binding protein [Lachnospiraceae bacterium]
MKQKSTLGYMIGFASECKGKMAVSIILGIIGVICGMFPYYSIIKIVSALYDKTADAEMVLKYIGFAFVGEALKYLLSTKSMMLAHDSAYTILETIRKGLSQKMMRVPLGAVSDTPSGKIKSMIVDTVEKLEKPLAHMLPEITANVVTPLLIVIYLFSLDWRMALASLISFVIGMIAMMGQMKDYETHSSVYMNACADMDSTLVEYVNGIQVIKAFQQSARSFERFSKVVNHYHDSTLAWWKSTQFFAALGGTIIPSTLIGTLPVGAYLYMTGGLPFGQFVGCIVLAMGIAGPIMQATSYVDQFAVVDASVKQITEFLEQDELVRTDKCAFLDGKGFEFKGVSFAYGDKEVLHKVDFKPAETGMTAIVGPSGGGKSTIAKLLAGFYDPTEGDIFYKGKNLKDIPFSQLMEEISFVSQDNYLFDMSIMENIRVGRKEACDDEVIQKAKAAGCHEFIRRLENGYDTKAGDVGKFLSGGERQRIAIARAMMKPAKVIILDEATAYVDPENEQVIQQAIGELVKDKILIVIAHRLSTIVNAEKIVVVRDGNIEAEGNQKELLKNCPLYRKMWEQHIAGRDSVWEKED